MSDDLRKLIADGERLGFTYVGQTSRGGHMQFIHESGQRVTASCTPSDRFAWVNVRNDMERISGRQLPRSGKAGSYKFKPVIPLKLHRTETEIRNSETIDRLLDRVGVIRSEFRALALSPDSHRCAQKARKLVDEFTELRDELALHHRIVDPIY